MENDKSYIPKLEELHVGFEVWFQNIENAQWGKYVINENDNICALYENNIDFLRAKFLDKDDIVSLGWTVAEIEEKGHLYCYIGIIDYDCPRKEFTCLRIRYVPQTKWCLITATVEKTVMEHSIVRFSGRIKNKSELRKLMSQLGLK